MSDTSNKTSPAAKASLSGAGTAGDHAGTEALQGATGGLSSAAEADASPVKPIGSAAMADQSGGDRAGSDRNAAQMAEAAKAEAQDVKAMAQETGAAAKARAAELADTAKAEAAAMAGKAQDMARDKAEEAKGYASSEIERTAETVRAAGREFGEGSYPAQAADYLASGLHDAAAALRDRDVGSMVDEVGRFARRNPGVFLGGAALLGFAVARMIKASERQRHGGMGYDEARIAPPPRGVGNTPYDISARPVRPNGGYV